MSDEYLNQLVNELQIFVDLDKNGKTNKEIILEHFGEVLEYVKYREDILFDYIMDECIYDSDYDKVIEKYLPDLLKRIPLYRGTILSTIAMYNPNAILTNFDKIFSQENEEKIFDYFQAIKGKNRNLDKAINSKIRENSKNFVMGLWFGSLFETKEKREKCKFWRDAFDEKEKEECKTALDIVLREVLDETNKDYTDIEFVGEGSYSTVYRIGNKVIKFGDEILKYQIPNHRRFLQPIARANYTLEDKSVMAYFEVTSYADTFFSEKEQDDEKLYQIYKELRDSGIVWIDAKWENVGKLLDDNVTKWRGQVIDVAPNSVGFSKSYEGEPLKRGDMVIIDLDYLFREDDPNLPRMIDGYSSPLSIEFEEKYKREKKREKERDDDER